MDVFTLCFEYPGGFVETGAATTTTSRHTKPVFHPTTPEPSVTTTTEEGVATWKEYVDGDVWCVAGVRRGDDGKREMDEEFDEVHQRCLRVSAASGCLVSAVKAPSSLSSTTGNGNGTNTATTTKDSSSHTNGGNVTGDQSVWQFQVSGSNGPTAVMNPRRMILEEFKPEVETTIKVPAIHILKSIHSSSHQTPLHPRDGNLTPGNSEEGLGVKPEVLTRLAGIGERTGARVRVRIGKGDPGKEVGPFSWVRDQATTGTHSASAVGAGPPSATATTTHAQPPIADSARSKSMYPILPQHPSNPPPTIVEDVRTNSPEPLVESPKASGVGAANPWGRQGHGDGNVRSKTFDETRPRVAGIKSPVHVGEAAQGQGNGQGDLVEELKVWGFAEERMCEVSIAGREECVRAARLLLLVYLDELNGLAQDVLELDHRIQYILAGRKRQTINAIEEETNTNIYLAPTTSTVFLPDRDQQVPATYASHLASPILGVEMGPSSPAPTGRPQDAHLAPPFVPGARAAMESPTFVEDGLQDSIARLCISSQETEEPGYLAGLREMRNRVYVTGAADAVMNAREILSRLAYGKTQNVFTKEAAVIPRKLDWVVSEKQREVSRIMSDNGSHVEFLRGPQVSIVKVYGDHRLSVDRTMKYVMLLFAELTLATVFTMSGSDAPLYDEAMESGLKSAASTSKAEVAYKPGQFQVCGTLAEVRQCLPLILTSDAVKNTTASVQVQCELGIENESFISGKRNGKINKITRTTSSEIRFEKFNNHNFIIDVRGPGLKVLEALELLQDELPAEISFHIPESYHRRIIGKGGASVQDVMRRHSAFVKFSSTEQWSLVGGYFGNEDNVICITPSKNRDSLVRLRADLMLSILTKDRDYGDWIIEIDRKYHRALQAETRAYLHHIEVVHGANIRFLPREDGQDAIEVFASRYQAKVIRDLLTKVLPVELTCSFNHNVELAKVAASSEWLEFTTLTLQDLQVSILPYSQLTAGSESIFVLKCQRQNLVRLKEARARLDMFLRSQPKYAQPFDWNYGLMKSRSETLGPHGTHRRGMSTVVYGSEELARTDMPKSAGLRRADTIGGQVLDGWRARKQMHKRRETEDGRIDMFQHQSGNYPPPIARPVESPQPPFEPELPRQKGLGGRTQSLDIRNLQDFAAGGHSRHASFVSVEQAYNQAGAADAGPPSAQPAGTSGTSTFPRFKPTQRRGVSVYEPLQE